MSGSDFHISVDIPEGATAEEVTAIRGEAFRMALIHAATDPGIREKMLAGEERAKMRMVPVDSSNLARIGYDETSRELHIEFKSGAQHTYLDVPVAKHSALMAAPSHGGYFASHILPHHTSKRMGGMLPQQDEPGAEEAERYPRAAHDTSAPRSIDEAIERFVGDG